MKNNIMYDLFFGKFNVWERKPKMTTERREVNRRIEEEKRYFISKMSLEDTARFQALERLYSEADTFEEVEIFACGVELGILLMIAVFGESEHTETEDKGAI